MLTRCVRAKWIAIVARVKDILR